jgi:hypothetical protein
VGKLARHPIHVWVHQYRLRTFVETGTFKGEGLAYALEWGNFELFHSIEANPELAEAARRHFAPKSSRVFVWTSESVPMVRMIERGAARPALWWLDAHLPELYGTTTAEALPLLDEVRAIVAGGRHHRDVILMDDLRLYARRAFASGNYSGEIQLGHLQQIRDLLLPTHELREDLNDEGYLLALPR